MYAPAPPWKGPFPKIRFKNVTASSVCANDKAQSLKYEAVLDTVPRANSMVSIIWWMNTSPKL